tara:strand:+ start:22161 stop:22364 length:204 start_codon:yes stop_codon:yes gene_type:complete
VKLGILSPQSTVLLKAIFMILPPPPIGKAYIDIPSTHTTVSPLHNPLPDTHYFDSNPNDQSKKIMDS